MTISPGTRLGPYEIVALIGAGGMGEVYKARDTRLDRSVAVKILPAEFGENAQLKLRFEREAKTISQLSHPHICTLYDVGENYLVMELLDGESLADRLSKGPLPIEQVLRYGVQIGEALDKAHRAGIVHRDLKPGNVMITKSGAKLLDFGLAKPAAMSGVSALTGLATEHRPLTQEGTIVGTFQYMAPEQIEGREADVRTDIFAFGAVLYEMATGKRAFDGKSKASLIASILDREPPPISAVQPMTPAALEHVIAKCLDKDPDARWQSAHDIAEELRWIAGRPEAPSARGRSGRAGWFVAAALLLALALAAAMLLRKPAPRILYSEMNTPEETTFAFDSGAAVISPDGTTIIFPAATTSGVQMLWVRSRDSATARSLKGTENAWFPFWSPDSRSIAFFSDAKLKRMEVASGAPETIADASTGRGGTWGVDNTIVFAPSLSQQLYRVSPSGGAVRPVTELNIGRGDTSHRFPVFLPDGRHFLAFVQGANEGGNVLLGSTDLKETQILTTADGGVVFAPPNILLIVRDRVLRAQRMNLKTFAFEGDAVPLAENVQVSSSVNFVNVSASANGILLYVNGMSATMSTLTFFDATGKDLGSVGTSSDQLDPRVAPDGHAVLVSQNASNGNSDIVAYDLRRNISTKLTFSPANEFGPVWSPDSRSFVYTSFDKRPGDLFTKREEGSGNGEPLYADKRRKVASDWTRDGKYIIYNVLSPGTSWDIEAYSIVDHKTIPLVKTATAETLGHVSPDGRWLAYVSLEAGRGEVYVQRFPPTGERWQISGGGGTMPLWSRDGRQLFYVSPDGKMMAAAVNPVGNQFAADAPHALFSTRVKIVSGVTRAQYDVTSDGRFLINVSSSEDRKQAAVTLVENWTSKLNR
ncbi:MAG: serine/threonine-protein kinase [Acidobacteriota bacterium]|nr:serine/threonine-protein kinase [Acidobacteriota bacterium]